MTADLRIAPQRIPQPTDRFKLTLTPLVSPGKCACCGAVNRPVVDFDMTIQFYGAVLLCITCLAEASRLIDMVPVVELHTAEQYANQSLSSQLAKLGMRTITDEQFESISMAFGGLSDALLSIEPSDVNLVANTATEDQLKLFDFVKDESTGITTVIDFSNNVIEQEHDIIVSEGPPIISASNGDGDDDFFRL